MLLVEGMIHRTYFAEKGTFVDTWKQCFESEIETFKENKYSVHLAGTVKNWKKNIQTIDCTVCLNALSS